MNNLTEIAAATAELATAQATLSNTRERVARIRAENVVITAQNRLSDLMATVPSPPVTPEQEQAAAQVIHDYTTGQLGVGDAVVKRIRTIVPLVVGPLLTLGVTRFPAAGDFLASVDLGWRELVYGAASAGLGYGWWALAGLLGKKWPIAEKLMLGSSKRPIYVDNPKAPS